MRIFDGKAYRDLTPEEIAQMQAEAERAEAEYWLTTSYDDAVDAEIRKRYSVSAEFAILRQRDEKTEEYAAYYAYCEDCKEYCRQMRSKYEVE